MNTTNTSNDTIPRPGHLGWTSTPNSRGSIDILYSCFATLFLCSWTVLRLNIPSTWESERSIFLRKLKWMIIALLLPEFVTGLAFFQWMRAWCAKTYIKDGSWAQAWLYASGGIRYSIPKSPSPSTPTPETEREEPRIIILLRANRSMVMLPKLLRTITFPSTAAILALDKTDSLAKIIAVLQVVWFSAQCISRAGEKLPISQLEIGTIAFVGCTLLTNIFWWTKPLDIRKTHTLTESELVEWNNSFEPDPEMLSGAGIYLGGERLPNFSFWSQAQAKYQRCEGKKSGEAEWVEYDGKHIIGFDNGSALEMIFGAVLATFLGSVHIAAWNFEFPTPIEQTTWRVAALVVTILPIFTLFALYIVAMVDVAKPIRWLEHGLAKATDWLWLNGIVKYWKLRRVYEFLHLDEVARLLGNPLQNFMLNGPMLSLVIYIPARLVLAEMMFMSFRSMPAGVYDTVQWAENVLHI